MIPAGDTVSQEAGHLEKLFAELSGNSLLLNIAARRTIRPSPGRPGVVHWMGAAIHYLLNKAQKTSDQEIFSRFTCPILRPGRASALP